MTHDDSAQVVDVDTESGRVPLQYGLTGLPCPAGVRVIRGDPLDLPELRAGVRGSAGSRLRARHQRRRAAGRHPAWVGEVYQAVIEHLRTLGPVHEDAVNVGVFLKSDRKLAQFRPKVRSAELWLFLPEAIDDPRISRSMRTGVDRAVSLVKLTAAGEVDDQVRAWLTTAYDLNTD